MPIIMMLRKMNSRRMQWQIVYLIISFATYVSGIRNGANKDASTTFVNGEESGAFYPSEQLTHDAEAPAARQITSSNFNPYKESNGGFRPSQIIEFTHSDVADATPNKYPPSYLEPNQYPFALKQKTTPIQAMDKQFTFPKDEQQAARQQYNQYQSSTTSIPTELQSTPIVTYVDPYSNENINYRPSQQSQQSNSADYYRPEAPQAYTVQSMLLVGSHQRPSTPDSDEEVYLKRPGYVFDERPPIYGTFTQRPVQPTQPPHFLPTRLPSSIASAKPTRLPPTPPPIRNQKISYDSHDYPPPSYSQQQTSNFVQLPERYEQPDGYQQNYIEKPQKHRQRIDNYNQRPFEASPSSIHESSYAPNYANNFGNYLQGSLPQQQQYQFVQNQHQQYPQNYKRPSEQPPFNHRPIKGASYETRPPQSGPSNYYQYQIGEIPPPPVQQHELNYRPPTASSQHGSNLASLASLFGNTQQYAPQFASLLLGAGGPTSSSSYPSTPASSSNPLGSILGAFGGSPTQSYPNGGSIASATPSRPLNTQLIKALENIARNDDLHCVPKVLCQMIAAQTQRGQLPSFITSPAITNFLAGFPVASPALIYGRAALLGISGGERSCAQTYAKCPKNEYEILHYLNNHRGGFFKFFSEPEEQSSAQQSSNYGVSSGSSVGSGSNSLFSIFSALTGNSVQHSTPTTTPRPITPAPDIADSIGNFFTRVLSEYLSGVEYQRRRRRARRSLRGGNNYQAEIKADIEQEMTAALDFHDEEDGLDTRNGVSFQDSNEKANDEESVYYADANENTVGALHFPIDENTESRILKHKEVTEGTTFFPETPNTHDEKQRLVIFQFNRDEAHRKLRFPRESTNTKIMGEKTLRFTKHISPQDGINDGWEGTDLNTLKFQSEKPREKRVVFRPDLNTQIHDYQHDQIEQESGDATHYEMGNRKGKQIVFHDDKDFDNDQIGSYAENNQAQSEDFFAGKPILFQIDSNRETVQNHAEHQQTPNAISKDSAPPQRGARVVFPDHYDRFIRKGRILNRPTYAPTYENYLRDYSNENDRFVVSDSHRFSNNEGEYDQQSDVASYNKEKINNFPTHSYTSMNYGEYMPAKTSHFLPTIKPSHNQNQQHYNYPNTNYVSDNRYSNNYQKHTRNPKQEDDKNIYINNAQGITEYYVTPDGRKIYL